MLHKKTVLVKKLLFDKLDGCKNTAFLQKIYVCKKAAFLCDKATFLQLSGCKNTAFLSKKAAFLQIERL